MGLFGGAVAAGAVLNARDFACTSLKNEEAREAWRDLRTLVGRLPLDADVDVPSAALHSPIFGEWFAKQAAAREVPADEFDWLQPLPVEEDCRLGRWTGWLLRAEVLIERGFGDLERIIHVQLDRPPQTDPSPFEFLLSCAGESVVEPSWNAVGDSSWNIFSLAARVRRKMEPSLRRTVPLRGEVAVGDTLRRLLHPLHEELVLLIGVPEDGGPVWTTKAKFGRRWQATMSAWAKSSQLQGLDRIAVITAALRADGKFNFFELFHRLWLEDAILLRLPEAFHGFADDGRYPFDLDLLDDARWQNKDCGRFVHPHRLHGIPNSRGVDIAARLTSGRSRWPCGIYLRLLRNDHLISSKVRSFAQLDCSAEVLRVLRRLGKEAKPSGQRVVYFDVGTNLGDCAIAASTLVPRGRLHTVAIDADPRMIPLVRQTATVNGLSTREVNASWLEARLALISDIGQGNGSATISLDEHIGAVADAHMPEKKNIQVPVSTLDVEIGSHAVLHLVSIHGNGYFEMSALRGAVKILKEQRIHCLLVTCPAEEGCKPLLVFLAGLGYTSQELLDWVASSPSSMAEANGGRVCAAGQQTIPRADL